MSRTAMPDGAALGNQSARYTRIRGALANLGHDVGRGTIANILSEHGIEPAPTRDKHTSWSTFLKAHADCPAATDFFSVEVWTIRGLVTHFFGQASLRHAIHQFMAHYHAERNHQGLENQLLQPAPPQRHFITRFSVASASAECSTITTA